MLILSRKPNESIIIDGRITVKIVRVDGDTVKVGIAAPPEIPIHRQEVYEEIQLSNLAALTKGPRAVPKLSPERQSETLAKPNLPAGSPASH